MSKLSWQINRHNKSQQQLNIKYAYNLTDFLRFSTGNMFITGGTKEKRREVIESQTNLYRQDQGSPPIVIFSNDECLKNALIGLAENGSLGRLYIADFGTYRGYDFFRGMPINFISGFFARTAQLKGIRDSAKLLTYTDAFLEIMSALGVEITLSSMIETLRNNDTRIAAMSDNEIMQSNLLGSPEGGALLRNLCTAAQRAFSTMSSPIGEEGLCIQKQTAEDCVFLISIPSENYEFFAAYFEQELRACIGKPITFIFDDSPMLNDTNISEAVDILKQNGAGDIILSYDNVLSVQHNGTVPDNFNRQIIFLNGNMPAVAIQQIFSAYGQFTQMMPVENTNTTPALFFSLRKSRNASTANFVRDRVLLQELSGVEAVLSYGGSAEITAAKKLIIN